MFMVHFPAITFLNYVDLPLFSVASGVSLLHVAVEHHTGEPCLIGPQRIGFLSFQIVFFYGLYLGVIRKNHLPIEMILSQK